MREAASVVIVDEKLNEVSENPRLLVWLASKSAINDSYR
jgi:hypothetical protein